MSFHGLWAAAGVAAGITLARTVLPLDALFLGGGAVLAGVLLRRRPGLWIVAVVLLGAHRETVHRQTWESARVTGPRLFRGVLEVVAESGSAAVLRAGGRTVRVSEPPAGLPPPGFTVQGLMRVDPLDGRADPAAFSVAAWSRSSGLHGRGRLLGSVADAAPAPGLMAAARRAAAVVRARARDRLAHLPARERALLTALLLGDRRHLADSDRDRFRRAGLAHVLALSGMHTGVLVLGLGALLRSLRVPARAVLGVQLLFLVAFGFLTGARPSILRACATSAIALGAAAAGRRPAALHALGLVAAALLTANPAYWADVGFRLSFLATGVLIAASRSSGSAGPLREGLRLSALVTVGTVPVLAESFGAVSVLSPLTNLLAAAPATAALGWGALAAFPPWPESWSRGFAGAAAIAARALLAVVDETGSWRGAQLDLPAPGVTGTAACFGTVALAAGWRPSRRIRTPLLVLAGLGTLMGVRPALRYTVFDVGQGSAALAERSGVRVLHDAGPPAWSGESALAESLRYRGLRRIDAVVFSHAHADHVGGWEGLPRPGGFRVPARPGETPATLRKVLAGREAVAVTGPARPAPGTTLRTPWPRGEAPAGTGENDLSVFLRWEGRRISVLNPGDAERAGETAIRETAPASFLRATVLVAGHHGSRTSSTEPFLEAVRPRVVVISCGRRNVHRHPHREALDRIRAVGAVVLRTDRHGTVAFRETARGLRIRWTRGFPGPRQLQPSIPLSNPAPIF